MSQPDLSAMSAAKKIEYAIMASRNGLFGLVALILLSIFWLPVYALLDWLEPDAEGH